MTRSNCLIFHFLVWLFVYPLFPARLCPPTWTRVTPEKITYKPEIAHISPFVMLKKES